MIRINNLSIRYDKKEVIKDFSLEINKGDFIFIKGQNGSGKTTLLKTIAGLISYDNGSIDYQNINREKISYISQFISLEETIPMTCLEMLMMVDLDNSFLQFKKNHQKKKTAAEWLEKMKLNKNELIGNLSGGQKRRLYLTKAFLDQGDFFLLDEPFANLDEESTKILIFNLKQTKDATIIITDHTLSPEKISKKIKTINL